MSWILSRKNGLTSPWLWSLQMAFPFSTFFFFFFCQIEKNKSITWAAASLLLSFQSFPAADLFANMHFPCVTDTPNNLLNGMLNLTFRLLGCLIHWTCFLLFIWPLRFMKATPPFAPLSIPCLSINLFCYFSIPSWFRPEDLTFKWQLFPDLFINLPPCLVLPTGSRSEVLCPAEWVSSLKFSHGCRLWKHGIRERDVPEWGRKCRFWIVMKHDSYEKIQSCR